MEKLTVYACPLPFSNKQVKHVVNHGTSLAEILERICPYEHIGAVITINGYDIPRENWSRVKPKPNTLINIRVVPQGGGGGKNPIATLLSIAVLVAAPYLGAAYGAAFGTALGVSKAIGTALITGLTGAIGSLLISALAPPPKPSYAGSISNPAESPTQFIEGASNIIDPFGVIPVCLGTNRMFPKQAARPFTETQDNDQYVRQLFTYGFGDRVVVSDFKLGETSISEFSDIEMEHRLEGDLHESTNLFSNSVLQDDYSVLLNQSDGFITRTTQIDVDEGIVDFTFPQGLAEFNSQGQRISRSVQVEVQFAPKDQVPQVWSPAITLTPVSGASFPTIDGVITNAIVNGNYIAIRRDIIVINPASGIISRIVGASMRPTQPLSDPVIPQGTIRLGTINLKIEQPIDGFSKIISVQSIIDNRQPSQFGDIFGSSSDFLVSNSGTTIIVAGGSVRNPAIDVRLSQTEAARRSIKLRFPQKGTYDIRMRRITSDTNSDQIFDKIYLTAIKNVRYTAPVNLPGLNGTAMRIRATDQLNGSPDQFNCIVSLVIPDFNPDTGLWEERITSNPASIYRYVLQGGANGVPLPDNRVDITQLERWHVRCTQQNYTYNRIIDYDTTVSDILQDVAAAGAASRAIVDGKESVAIDMPNDDVVQIITPRNSWGFSGQIIFPDLPHAFRTVFRNSTKGYQLDERIVYDDGYNQFNASKFETLELISCTNSELAFRTARRHIATARLRPEILTFSMDVENLVAQRGNRIKFVNDVPLVGIGSARVKSIQYADESAGRIQGFTLDDVISIPKVAMYYVRIRRPDGTYLYREINAPVGDNYSFTFIDPVDVEDEFFIGDLSYVVEAGKELDLIITKIEPGQDLSAKITAVNYAPEIFDAENAPIPSWNSNVTTPLELIRPYPPVLLDQQSDERVSLLQSDGSILSRAVFTLSNTNDGDISVSILVRLTGTDIFAPANILQATPELVILTGMQDNSFYDIHIRYRRPGGSMYSKPLEINGFQFMGQSTPPADVTGFLIDISGDVANFKWNSNQDIDLSHYELRFSNLFEDVTFENAQIKEDQIFENRITTKFLPGTYFIKAVDRQGNKSVNAAVIITYNPGNLLNAVADLIEEPEFSGAKDNIHNYLNGIVLAEPNMDGYYYFSAPVILDGFYVSTLSASIQANAIYMNNIFEMDDIFSEPDLFGAGQNDIFAMDDIFQVDDIFGIGIGATEVQLQYRTIDVDPDDSSAVWSDWAEFRAGDVGFYAIEFRLRMRSLRENVSPYVRGLSVRIDMPDRIERYNDLMVPTEGIHITFNPPFRAIPSSVATIQTGDGDDEIRLTNKTRDGLDIAVFNKATSAYVSRIVDTIHSGWGRKN